VSRLLATAAIVAVLTGSAGFVWWGLPLQRLRGDVDALFQRRNSDVALRAELVSVTARLKAAEAELRRERELRTRLETIARDGRAP
jgi:hypothetical protein